MLVESKKFAASGTEAPAATCPGRFQCEYAQLWEVIAERYDIQLESSDRNEIKRVLKACPADALNSSLTTQ